MLQAIAGCDRNEISSAEVPTSDYVAALQETPGALRVGIPRSFFFDDLDQEIPAAIDEALAVITKLSAGVREITFPVATDRTVQTAESYAYHAKSVAQAPELYQPETLRRIRAGANVSAADYIHRRRELDEARRAITSVFDSVDLLVTPTIPTPPPIIADLKENPDLLRPCEILMLRNTRPVNAWGVPAISIPCGFTAKGLPIGLQIIGPHWREDLVLQLAYAYEQATGWHTRHPAFIGAPKQN